MARFRANNEIIGADIAKMRVINNLKRVLFLEQLRHLNRTIRGFVDMLPPSYGGFIVFNKTFSIDDIDEFKIKIINPESDLFERAEYIYRAHKQIHADMNIVEHFLAMFLNKCPNKDEFFEIFPEMHFQNLIAQAELNYTWTEFNRDLYRCISYRQNLRPTKPHQYEIFLSDQEDRVNLVKKYVIDTMLLG